MAAVDGSKIEHVYQQLRRVPEDATHLVLSIGGNDALGSSDFLSAPVRSTAEALLGLAGIGEGFERGYRSLLAEVLAQGLPTAICTVYYPLPAVSRRGLAEGGGRGTDRFQRLHRQRGVHPRPSPTGSAVDLHRRW